MEQLAYSLSSISSAAATSVEFFWDALPNGVVLSFLASLGTGLGALPALFTSRLSDRWRTILLSVGGGVMISAAAFSLLMPALSLSIQSYDVAIGAGEVAIAALIGAALLYGLESLLPEPEVQLQASQLQSQKKNSSPQDTRGLWLFVLAIALHHLPEGLAVGLGVESTQNWSIAWEIALQNVPEGLMVALALRELGYGIGLAIAMATVSGWLEPVGGLLGVLLADWSMTITPIGMALAAGAMIFVVLRDLLPRLNLGQVNNGAYAGLITGIATMGMVEKMMG